jgi:hypothetical protein
MKKRVTQLASRIDNPLRKGNNRARAPEAQA